MKQSIRQQIFDKYGGKCAYCGCDLVKGWHKDHIEPIVRNFSDNKICEHPERDTEENYNPSCASCNRMKSSMSIETFRGNIKMFVQSLNRYSVQYNFAKRYDLVQETDNDVIFYFEIYNKQKK